MFGFFQEKDNRIIVCSAIKLPNGKIFYGPRHNHCFKTLYEDEYLLYGNKIIQGFSDSRGDFYTREEACNIVLHNNQKIRLYREKLKKTGILFSEDLF